MRTARPNLEVLFRDVVMIPLFLLDVDPNYFLESYALEREHK